MDPYTTRTCCHTFCCECIVTALSVSRQCPIDRSPLTTDDLSPADPLLRNVRITPVLSYSCRLTTKTYLYSLLTNSWSSAPTVLLGVNTPAKDNSSTSISENHVNTSRSHAQATNATRPSSSETFPNTLITTPSLAKHAEKK